MDPPSQSPSPSRPTTNFKHDASPDFHRDEELIPWLSRNALPPSPPKFTLPPCSPSSSLFKPTLPPNILILPQATVQKIISEILATPSLPHHQHSSSDSTITFARDARELLIECCVEFITLISSEANEIAEKEQKKTIAIEHIDRALKDLGFPEYVKEVLASAGDAKELLKVSIPPSFLHLALFEGIEVLSMGWEVSDDVLIRDNSIARSGRRRWSRVD